MYVGMLINDPEPQYKRLVLQNKRPHAENDRKVDEAAQTNSNVEVRTYTHTLFLLSAVCAMHKQTRTHTNPCTRIQACVG